MANEWMNSYLGVHPGSNPNTVGLTAYWDMVRAGYSNQQIAAGVKGRGLHVGKNARTPLSQGAQPNWMNQYTGSMGGVGLETYKRMTDAGYSAFDIQRDLPASGMVMGYKARDQMNTDIRSHHKNAADAKIAEAQQLAQEQIQQAQAANSQSYSQGYSTSPNAASAGLTINNPNVDGGTDAMKRPTKLPLEEVTAGALGALGINSLNMI